VTRVLGIGDSITLGLGVELEESFLKVLERRLRTEHAPSPEVINFGQLGFNMAQAIRLLEKKGLPYGPDLVILTICSNDLEFEGEMSDPDSWLGRINELLKTEKESALQSWIRQKLMFYDRKRYADGLLEDTTRARALIEGEFNRLSRVAASHGFQVMVVIPNKSPFVEDCLGAARERGFWTVDLRKPFEEAGGSFHLHPEDLHPNAAGHRAIASFIYDALEKKGWPDRPEP